jgi:ABC-2 type transport system permease protein
MIFRLYSLIKKELNIMFCSPFLYIITSLFMLIMGISFYSLIIRYVDQYQLQRITDYHAFFNQTVIQVFCNNLNLILVFLCSLITMKSFTQEYKTETFNLLLSSGLTKVEIYLGKFISSLIVVLFLISITFIFPLIISINKLSDFSYFFSGYMGLILNAICYVSIGLLASSLTANQVLSAFLSFGTIFLFWVLGTFSLVVKNVMVSQIIKYFSLSLHFSALSRGSIVNYDIVYYVSFFILTAYLTMISLDFRKNFKG